MRIVHSAIVGLCASGCVASDDAPSEPATGGCPAGVVCIDALPFESSVTLEGGGSRFDGYACAPAVDALGPEVVYQLVTEAEGFLAISLIDAPDSAVHLLASLDAADCVDRGDTRAGGFLAPGRYFVVVEGAAGTTAEIAIALTTADTMAAAGMDPAVASQGLRAFGVAWAEGDTERFEYAMSDFSLRSSIPRQWAVDLASGALLWNLHVPHGQGSKSPVDSGYAETFSNTPESHQSSLGMMRAAESYNGDFGYSFRLDGLEPGYNDNVRDRAIVVHPSEGSRPEYVAEHGEAQLTWGCPALDDRRMTEVVDTFSNGALLWFWYPDGDWSESSAYLQ